MTREQPVHRGRGAATPTGHTDSRAGARAPGAGALRPAGPVAVLVVALLLLWARPAAAHTELTASTPSAGAVTAASTTEVVLTFSGRVQGQFSTVAVVGPDGVDRARGPVAVRGGRVAQAVAGPLPAGSWELAYRVVAADGHPVTGTVPFTVAAAPAQTSAPASTSPPPVTQTLPPDPSASPSAVAAPPSPAGEPRLTPASDESPVSRALLPTTAVLAAVAAGAAVLVRRSRRP